MPLLEGERHRLWIRLLASLAVATLWVPLHGEAADRRPEDTSFKSVKPIYDYIQGTFSGEDLHLVQGTTVIRAGKAQATGVVDLEYRNSTWRLSDTVRLEFDGAVMDAQSAIAVFENGQLKTIEVQPAPAADAPTLPSPVHLEFDGAILDAHSALVNLVGNRIRTVRIQGSRGEPARFSHQFRNTSKRAHGRSATIDYDAPGRFVRFSGGTKFSYGTIESETEDAVIYSLASGTFEAEGETTTTIPREELVRPPRTPDRATAQ